MQRLELIGQVAGDVVRIAVYLAVAASSQADEVVVLGDDLPGRPREVDLEDGHVASEIRDVEDQVVGEEGGVSPDDPADAERGETELVSGGRDGVDPLDAEVPHELWCAERGDEATRGGIDVDGDVETGPSFQVVEGGGQGGDVFVAARVGDPKGGHHQDGVLVDLLEHLLWLHAEAAWCHADLADLDVPVASELVPDDLDRAADHVGLIGRLARLRTCLSPAPLGRHAGEHAGLRGADGRGPDRVGALGRVPQVGQHVDASLLELSWMRVLVLVNQVLVLPVDHQGGDVGLLPGLAEGGEVLARVAIQEQLVLDDLEGIGGVEGVVGELVARQRLLDVLADVDRRLEVLLDGLAVVERHRTSSSCARAALGSSRPSLSGRP